MNTQKIKPYIGITGFMSSAETSFVLGFALSTMMYREKERGLMVGVLASLKTITLGENKWSRRYPKTNDIKNIFLEGGGTLNLIHYNTKERDTLLSQLLVMTNIAGPSMNGFQLNMPWPEPSVLESYRNKHPDKVIVLQIGSGAYNTVGESPERLAQKVKDDYAGLAEYVLLDPSGGKGEGFSVDTARKQLEALSVKDTGMLLGVAGGLSSTNLNLIEPLIRDFPDLCIDAEGRLRTPQPEDRLDLGKASEYLKNSFDMFEKV